MSPLSDVLNVRREFADAYTARRDVASCELRGRLAWHDVGKQIAGLCACFLDAGMDERARQLADMYMRVKVLTSRRFDRRYAVGGGDR